MGVVAGVFVIAGASFTVLAMIGVLRFGDVYSRMHAASKAPTLGLLLIATGVAIELGEMSATATLVLVVLLQALTGPVGVHILGHAIHRRMAPQVDDVDELAEHERAQGPDRSDRR